MEDIIDKTFSFFNNISLENIFSFILNPEFAGVLLWIKIIFMVFSVLLLIIAVWLLLSTTWLRHRHTEALTEFINYKSFDAKKMSKEWQRIKKRLASNKETEHKLAVIEADSLLGEALRRKGYEGEGMADRLKKVDAKILPNIEQVWDAHKIRNNIVHNPDYNLSSEDAERAITVLEEAFESLEIA